MISCTEFISAYSGLFQFLHNKGGKPEVIKYWEHISDTYVKERLGKCVLENGIKGCYDYWAHSLNEEDADFSITLDEDRAVFELKMFKCPSKGRLLNNPQIKPYEHYCEHCDLLYRRVLEPYGLKYDFDMSKSNEAKCSITIQYSK